MDHAPAVSDRAAIGDRATFGIAEALREGYASLDSIAEGLRAGAGNGRPLTSEPFKFDSGRLCMLAYKEALYDVQWRFWTTTYLSSGFWGDENSDILQWNRWALQNLKRAGSPARRLFLLPRSAEMESRRWCDQRILMLKYDDAAGLANLDSRLASLCNNVERLTAQGCAVRTAYDAAARHKMLPAAISMDGFDSELAIYDDWRFDLFQGGQLGAIQSVKVYTPVMEHFDIYLRSIVEYFESLWREADPMADLLDHLRAASEQSAKRIDYHPIWLARYDHALPEDDDLLKRREFEGVENELRRRARWGRLRRFLDVGTCTGRYPIALRGAMGEDGQIFGVDNDRDAVRFARRNVAEACGGDARISIEQHDFCAEQFALAGPFDLITCMLGTLLHFSCSDAAQPPYADSLQRALERFAALLSDDGVLFFSIWTPRARRTRHVLSIYSEDDKQQLARWSVTSQELRRRLRAAGLDIVARARIEDRMDLYCCVRAAACNAGEVANGGGRHAETRQDQRGTNGAVHRARRDKYDNAREERH
jgi:SAM-dependent methyltransferase